MPKPEKIALKSDVVGLIGAATLGTVMLSPAMTLYGNFGPAYIAAGKAAPLVFVWGLLATLPTVISYALLSRAYPSSGSAAHWIHRSLSPEAGQWTGWIVFLYYFTNFILQPVTLGLFFNDLLTAMGVVTSFYTYAAGALLGCAWPAWIAFRGIAVSAKGALRFLLFEAAVVTALCLTIVGKAPGNLAEQAMASLSFASSPTGSSGVFRALVFAMLAFCGFDVVSTLGEEAKMPRKLIPQATFLCLLIFGAFIIAGISCLTFAGSPESLQKIAEAGGMPITEIARRFWGKGAILVPITGISAALGISVATAVGSSRILYSMGKENPGLARFSVLHERFQVPWNSMSLVFVGGIACAWVTGAFIGAYPSYVWWGTTSTFFAMITYMAVNLANLVLHRDRLARGAGEFFLHGVVPAFGIAVDGYILFRSFFVELWGQGWATGRSVIFFDVLCASLALAWVWRRRPLVADGYTYTS